MVTNPIGTGLKTSTDTNSTESGDCSQDLALKIVEPIDLYLWELQSVS